MTFATLVVAQLLHALTCRSRGSPVGGKAGQRPPNPALKTILGGSFALQLAALLVPGVRRLLGVTSIAPLRGVSHIACWRRLLHRSRAPFHNGRKVISVR